MLDTVFGLPVHPLIVHATVVMVPLATTAVLLAGVWPRFCRWAGWLPLLLALVSLALTPLSTQSGEPLQRRVAHSALVEEHSRLADGLLPWVAGLVVAAALTTVLWRRSRTRAPNEVGGERLMTDADRRRAVVVTPSRPLVILVAALAVVAAVGTTVQVVRIGHSGAQAAWSDVSGPQPASPSGAGD